MPSLTRPWTTQPQIAVPAKEGFVWTPAYGKATPAGVGVAGVYVAPTSAKILGTAPFVSSKTFTAVIVWAVNGISTSAELMRIGASGGFRLDVSITGSGSINALTFTLNGVSTLTSVVLATRKTNTTRPFVSLLSVTPTSTYDLTGVSGAPNAAFAPQYVEGTSASAIGTPADYNVQIIATALLPIYAVFVLPRAVGVSEAHSIRRNPSQLFAPLPRRIWAPAAGAPADIFYGQATL